MLLARRFRQEISSADIPGTSRTFWASSPFSDHAWQLHYVSHSLLSRCETAGGVVVATYRRLLREGLIDPQAEVVLLNTGDGLKTLDAVARSWEETGPTPD